MALSPGTRLGAYEGVAKSGEGGMVDMYLARNTELDRDVALKVLPEEFTSDPDRLARFEHPALMGRYITAATKVIECISATGG